jgi:hypothetical protein
MLLPLIAIGFGVYQATQLTQASGMSKEDGAVAIASSVSIGLLLFYLTLPVVSAIIVARTANLF